MRRLLQLAFAGLLVTTALHAQVSSPQFKRPKKAPKENVEWIWQYGPPPADGRENALVLDPHFRPFLAEYLTAPQTFWGDPRSGYKPLDATALDFLSVPDKVLTDGNRYMTITGCVVRFCPSRGLLWVDLGLEHPLIAFAAIDWIRESKPAGDPDAEYTMWVFANHPIDPEHIPSALSHSIARWTAQPPLGSKVLQKITNTVLVDPDGTPHKISPASIGANTMTDPAMEQKAKS